MRFLRQFLKLVCLTVAAFSLIVVIAVCETRPCFKDSESYSFFVGNTSKNCKEVRADSNTALTKLMLSGVCGECAEYSEFDFEEYLKSVNGEVIFVETLSDSVNYYCKADLPYSIKLYGEQINLHISVKDNGVKVGTPIIFGGY